MGAIEKVKMVVFVPLEAADRVRTAMADAGAGMLLRLTGQLMCSVID